jgi:hypothetical protein
MPTTARRDDERTDHARDVEIVADESDLYATPEFRHCERSEASSATPGFWIASALRASQ